MLATSARPASRRLVLSEAAALGGLGVLAACGQRGGQAGGQSSAGAPKGQVSLMTQGSDPTDEQRYKPLVDEHNARRGPVTIELIQGGGGATDQQGKLITLVVSGTPPDAFWTHANISPTLVKLNLVSPFDPYLKNDKDIKLTSYFEAPLKNYEAGGKQYGIPRQATTLVLVANKELFQKNGVALPTDSWTWDDHVKAAQQLTTPGSAPTWGASGWGAKWSMYYYPYVKV